MIVFNYIDLGSHLRGSVTVCCGCPQSSFVTSVVKSLLYFEALKTWYVLAKIQMNQAEWRFIAGFFMTLKPWLSIRGFLPGCLAARVHDEVAMHKRISLEREKCLFSN